MGDFFAVQSEFAQKFNCLQLTDSEIALMLGLIIINPCKFMCVHLFALYMHICVCVCVCACLCVCVCVIPSLSVAKTSSK